MRRYLIANNFPATLALFHSNSGNFPFSEDGNQFSARLDHSFSARDNLFFRANFNNGTSQNSELGALIGFNRGRSIGTWDGAVVLGNTFIKDNHWVSETRLMFGYDKLAVTPTDKFGPDITIAGYGSFGREIFLPSTTIERHFQLQQYMDYAHGRHTVKFGVDVNPVRDVARSETFFGGRFQFGAQIPLGLLLPQLTGDPNAAATLVSALTAFGQQALIPALSQPLTSLQAYNLGLPTL